MTCALKRSCLFLPQKLHGQMMKSPGQRLHQAVTVQEHAFWKAADKPPGHRPVWVTQESSDLFRRFSRSNFSDLTGSCASDITRHKEHSKETHGVAFANSNK